MRILITGGAGFIGSSLADKLLLQNEEIVVIDNFSTGRRDNLKPHPNLEIIEGSIANVTLVDEIFSRFKPEIVVHAAASYKDPDNWVEDINTNITGTVNVVNSSRKNGVKRFIYFQTSLCYGLHPVEQPITLSHPLFSGKFEGGSSYAISKTAGEQYIALSGLEFLSFRLANAYGPRNLSGPLPTFFHRLTNDKKCFVVNTKRDFIFVDDLTEVIVKAVNGMGIKGYYHISTGTDFFIKELFDRTVEALDLSLDDEVEVRERNEDDVFTILIDPSKTENDFNWKAITELKDGIKKTIEWYKINGIEQTYTHLKTEKK